MSPEEIISTITDRVKDTANVKVVFGEPVTAAGVTIIPVATVKVAGGGGGGKGRGKLPAENAEALETGMGLGLQVSAKPLGYIEVKDGAARLVPIVDVTKVAVVGLVAAGLTLITFGKLSLRREKLRKAKAYWAAKKAMHQPA
ncbi:MAG TPA: spore germination protein GerW family protein [Candidatus Pristimantibacillus sp.]|nr:spore germination protein GerW family protein [Candidatus Pristimantibacillus sp.]